MKRPQIFLSYARPDKEKVEDLYRKLSDAGWSWRSTQASTGNKP